MKKIAFVFAAFLALSTTATAQKTKLIIDAAHGGADAGARSTNGDKESDLCLQFAKALETEAAKKNIEVVMVRTTDEYKTLNSRNTFKTEAGVKTYFISFHMNAENTKTQRGATIQYNNKAKDAATSKALAEKLMAGFNLINDIGTRITDDSKALIVKNSEIPAVIVEPGYISNADDLRKMKDQGIQQEVAMLIVKAVTE